ncbi:MAG: hypothetical protein K0S40_1151 [Actinomycetospora sp.]|nr:hypothetical protein [Actinomycetospora sp.]
MPGAVMIPGVSTTREPISSTASTTCSDWKYISADVVTPPRSISVLPASIPAWTSAPSSFASAGQTTSRSQRISGRSPPKPRSTVNGVWAWALTSPGMSRPPTRVVGASVAGAVSAGPTCAIRPSSSTSTTASRSTLPASSQGRTIGAW